MIQTQQKSSYKKMQQGQISHEHLFFVCAFLLCCIILINLWRLWSWFQDFVVYEQKVWILRLIILKGVWEKQEKCIDILSRLEVKKERGKIGWNFSLQIKKLCLLPNSNNIQLKRPIKGPGIKRSTDRVTELSNKNQSGRQLSSFKGQPQFQ